MIQESLNININNRPKSINQEHHHIGGDGGIIPTAVSINHPPSIHMEVAQTASSVEQAPTSESNDHKKDSNKKLKKKKAVKNNEGKQATKKQASQVTNQTSLLSNVKAYLEVYGNTLALSSDPSNKRSEETMYAQLKEKQKRGAMAS